MSEINCVIINLNEYLNLDINIQKKYIIPDFIEINGQFLFNEKTVTEILKQYKNAQMIFLNIGNEI
jgi:hypothetical protein